MSAGHMGQGSDGMVAGMEQEGPHGAEQLEHPTDKEIEEMMQLRFDALDEGKSLDTRHERRLQTSRGKLYQNFLKEGKHGALFVVRESGRIIGFLALKADAPHGTGCVERLRTLARGQGQILVAQKLLTAAERHLRANPRNCTTATIKTPHPTAQLRIASRLGALQRFFRLEDESAEEGASPPEADNDTYKDIGEAA